MTHRRYALDSFEFPSTRLTTSRAVEVPPQRSSPAAESIEVAPPPGWAVAQAVEEIGEDDPSGVVYHAWQIALEHEAGVADEYWLHWREDGHPIA